MRLLLIVIFVFACCSKLAAQCPGNGYASSTELIKNGDFSNGNTDFSSTYTYCSTSNCMGYMPGYYTVDKDPSDYTYFSAGRDHSTGTGNFFIGNSDGVQNSSVWCQTVRVKPRTNYTVSAWFSKLYMYAFWGQVDLQFAINGTKIGSKITTPSDTGTWKELQATWYSGNNSSVTLCVYNMTSNSFFSGSFGIDDISMRECICNYPAQVSKDTAICAGDSALLKASYGNNYIWSPTNTISCSGCQEVVARPSVTTNYFVAVTDTSNCLSSASVKVTVTPVPKAKITGDSVVCNGNPITLKATLPGAKYLWSNSSTDSFITVNKAGKYWVHVNVNGCTDIDTFTVKETDLRFSLGNDTALCDGNAITLKVNTVADSIVWQDGSNNNSFAVTSAGKYWTTLITGNCSYTDTIEVKYKPNPVVDLGPDSATRCITDSMVLDAGNPGAKYLWLNTGDTTQTVVSKGNIVYGQGNIVMVNLNGCIAFDTIYVDFEGPYKVDLGNDTSVCEGSSIKITPKYLVNNRKPEFIWQDGSTTSEYIVTQPGKYWVHMKQGTCTASDTIEVKYRPNPVLNLGKDISICADEPVVLDAGILADKYIWNTGDTTQNILVKTAGKYFVEANINGCIAADSIEVNFLGLPVFDLGKDTTLCEGQTLLLHANIPNVKYMWQDGFISPYHTVTKAGTYWARLDNGTCDYTDTIHVKYNAYPTVELGEDTLLCPGEKLVLNVFEEGVKYQWSDGTTDSIKEITAAGKYWVKLYRGSCSAADTIHVFYNDSPQVNLGKDTTFCGTERWQLYAAGNNNPDATYEWNTGQKSPSIIVSEPGKYWAKVSYCGVSVTDTISLGFINYKPEDLLVPNAFSPNDDKLNDTLLAVGIDLIQAFEWRIYNRWGQLVYKSDDMKAGWDGKINAAIAPVGLYHWKLTLRSACLKDDELSRSGIVYLIR